MGTNFIFVVQFVTEPQTIPQTAIVMPVINWTICVWSWGRANPEGQIWSDVYSRSISSFPFCWPQPSSTSKKEGVKCLRGALYSLLSADHSQQKGRGEWLLGKYLPPFLSSGCGKALTLAFCWPGSLGYTLTDCLKGLHQTPKGSLASGETSPCLLSCLRI